MMDDLSRPARLASEAITLPAMEPMTRQRSKGMGALGAIRREWPSVQPDQHAIPLNWEDAQLHAESIDHAQAMSRAERPITMGRAALHSVLHAARR